MPSLSALLSPRSIAIVGASPDASIIRGKVQHVLQARGYPGPIHPISRSHAEVQGRKAYASVADLPEPPDLAIVIIPAAAVPQALEDCGRAGVKAAYVISSGFAEAAGGGGAALQQAIRDVAGRWDMTVCGPNAEGFFNTAENIVATFSPAVEDFAQPLVPETDKGRRIAVIAQSGGLGFAYFHRGRPRQLRFSHVISTGNEAALTTSDILLHLIETRAADIVLLYVESIRDPAQFRRAAGLAKIEGVPIVVAKMGRSDAGRRAAASHTAALAGSDAVCDAVFRADGVLRAHDMDEMLDIAAAFAFCPEPRGRRVAIMSGSGGAGVWMADTLAAHGLEVPELDPATRREIEALIPSYGASANPVDLTAQVIRRVGYSRIVEILQRSPLVDAVVVVGSLAYAHTLRDDLEGLARVAAHPEKPVVFCTYTLASSEAVTLAAQAGVPVYTSMAGCARALAAMRDYEDFQDRWIESEVNAPATRPGDLDAELRQRDALHRRIAALGPALCEYEAKALLAEAHVPVPEEILAEDREAAAASAARLGFPVALKLQSPDILHKTEVGGVRLGLASADAVRTAFDEIVGRGRAARPDADIRGCLVARMAPPGVEVIVGTSRDPEFGPMLMVGLGGIHVEVLRDVVLAPASAVDDVQARHMLTRLQAAKLLAGVRGAPPADTASLARLMVSLARFAAGHSETIREIDLNPVIVHPRGLTVVDALIVPG